MSQSYVGQIQPFGFNFAPKNWMYCNGQLLPVQQYSALFALLGTMYGGNGTTNFALPNLQSRVPQSAGTSPYGTYVQGETGGVENVPLDVMTMPAHSHTFYGSASGTGNDTQPDNSAVLANIGNNRGTAAPYYAPDTTPQPLNPLSIGFTGGNQAHANMQPYLAVNWCICMVGIFPARN